MFGQSIQLGLNIVVVGGMENMRPAPFIPKARKGLRLGSNYILIQISCKFSSYLI